MKQIELKKSKLSKYIFKTGEIFVLNSNKSIIKYVIFGNNQFYYSKLCFEEAVHDELSVLGNYFGDFGLGNGEEELYSFFLIGVYYFYLF